MEELEPKRELFAELDRITRPDAVLATNTSALSVSANRRSGHATSGARRRDALLQPGAVLPLVEIVRAPPLERRGGTDGVRWAEGAGKRPVNCNDTPGFIVNRILIPLLNDCVRVLDEAGVTPEDLDTAMTNGAGWPMGPCALVDLVGIDVHVHASDALHAQLGEARMAAPGPSRRDAARREARPQVGPGLLLRTDRLRRTARAGRAASERPRATPRAGCSIPGSGPTARRRRRRCCTGAPRPSRRRGSRTRRGRSAPHPSGRPT